MKKLLMLTLVLAGVLTISACEEEVYQPSNRDWVDVPLEDPNDPIDLDKDKGKIPVVE
jgi:hypothetical protein